MEELLSHLTKHLSYDDLKGITNPQYIDLSNTKKIKSYLTLLRVSLSQELLIQA